MTEGIAWVIGLLFAVFGPLLFLPVIAIVYRWPLRAWLGDWTERHWGSGARMVRFGIATVLVGVLVLATYLPGRLKFARLCDRHAIPVIAEAVTVPGFYRTALYPFEAEQFLREWDFSYIEGPDMYRQGRTLRYALGADGKTIATEIPTPISRYAASHTTRVLGNTLTLSEKRVFELATNGELAHAGSVTYHGGPLSLVLGVYGMSHCPNPLHAIGRQQFDDYYYLERKVLRAQSAIKNPQ